MIIRRELSDNFCFYKSDKYDSLKGGYEWAQKTLNDHRDDKREKVYTKEQLEKAKTYDKLWNAAQVCWISEFRFNINLLKPPFTTVGTSEDRIEVDFTAR